MLQTEDCGPGDPGSSPAAAYYNFLMENRHFLAIFQGLNKFEMKILAYFIQILMP